MLDRFINLLCPTVSLIVQANIIMVLLMVSCAESPNPSSCRAVQVVVSHTTEEARRIIEDEKLDVNCYDENGDTPVLAAIKHGVAASTIDMLYELGAQPNVAGRSGKYTPLSRAVRPYSEPEEFTERADLVEALLRGGEDPNAHLTLDEAGPDLIYSPLARAAGWSDTLTVLLVDAGANPNAIYNGSMPLMQSVMSLSYERVRLLVCEAGADVNMPMSFRKGKPGQGLDFFLERNDRIKPESRLYSNAVQIRQLIEQVRESPASGCP